MDELQKELAEIHARTQLTGDYQKTLALLRALKDGEISLANVEMLPDGWRLIEAPQLEAVLSPLPIPESDASPKDEALE